MLKRKMIKFIVPTAMVFSCATAVAQHPQAVSSAGANTFGANTNSDVSDEKYRESREHHHQAHQHRGPSGAPDQGLMSKALGEARQAFAAGQQAKEMANAALSALKTQSTAQDQYATPDPSINIQRLEEIAGQQSQIAMEMQQTFAKEGYSLGVDQTTVSNTAALTPTGGAAVPAATVGAARGPASIASASPMSPQTALSGIQNNTGNPADSQNAGGKNSLLNSSLKTDSPGAAAGSLDPLAAKQQAALDAQMALERNRSMVSKQLGIKNPIEEGPIRAKNEDIFQVVHTHYSSLRERGIFFESGTPESPPEQPDGPPAYSRGL